MNPPSAEQAILDAHYMARALELARNGLYTTHPNPRVGCVIVRDGQIVGEGWHVRTGEPHAEVHALRAAADKARGATAYVTLEPCSHYGHTPPCADALVSAGVARVVAAMQDPNPDVAGRGMQRLAQAGIEVRSGVLEVEARALNKGFLKRMEHGLPFVRVKLAMSLDGRTAMASGESQWITGPAARAAVQRLRAEASVVLTGADTVLADGARLTVRAAELGLDAETTALAMSRPPLRVLIDGRLRCRSMHRSSRPARRWSSPVSLRKTSSPVAPSAWWCPVSMARSTCARRWWRWRPVASTTCWWKPGQAWRARSPSRAWWTNT